MKFDYTFMLNTEPFYTMKQGDEQYVMTITGFSLYVQRVQLSPTLTMTHAQMLQSRNMIYECNYIQTHISTISMGSWSYHWENCITSTQLPTAVLFAFVPSRAYSGNYSLNPFAFSNMNITNAVVKLGTVRFPSYELNMDFARGDTQLGLWELLKALGYSQTKRPPSSLNRDNYNGAGFMLGVDLSRDGKPSEKVVNSNLDSTTMSLSCTFDLPTTEAYTCKFKKLFNLTLVHEIFTGILFAIYQTGILELTRHLTPITSW